GRFREGTHVVAPPSNSGATWVGQRTDQKTFARPYAFGVRNRRDRTQRAPERRPRPGRRHRATREPRTSPAVGRTRCGAREPDGRNARMLEPTEPTQGSESNTPSDTLPPRRRRRAASRPAGPPAGTS